MAASPLGGKPAAQWSKSQTVGGKGQYLWSSTSRLVALPSPRLKLAPSITSLDSAGLAAQSKELAVGDRILHANGNPMNASELEEWLGATTGKITLVISRNESDVTSRNSQDVRKSRSRVGSKHQRRHQEDVTWWEHIECNSAAGETMPNAPVVNDTARAKPMGGEERLRLSSTHLLEVKRPLPAARVTRV